MPAPDVFVVTREAWRAAIAKEDYVDELPLLVIEVISPANRRRNVEEKAALYLSSGIRHVWLAYPKLSRIMSARMAGDKVVQEPIEAITCSDPVAFSIPAPVAFAL